MTLTPVTPVTFHELQVVRDGWQILSSTTVFIPLSEEDEIFYSQQPNTTVGESLVGDYVPQEIRRRLSNEGGEYRWVCTSDTQTWETEISESITIDSEIVWRSSYITQR
jgi:hypothetical protein